uniref:FLYWCH-type domain-containing protein n=1 Tax=Rhabditophanes sp. KR3021 TaxID=114890 RepID=A0AC35U1G3_9BILA
MISKGQIGIPTSVHFNDDYWTEETDYQCVEFKPCLNKHLRYKNCEGFLSAEDVKKHVVCVGKAAQTIGRRMTKHISDYNKAVELDQVFTNKEKTMNKVFNSGQEMVVL